MILAAAFRVHSRLGPGLLESVYLRVLGYELTKGSAPLIPVASVRAFLPLQSAIFRDNSAKRIDIALSELLTKLVKILPRIPLRTDQFPGNPVAYRGCKIDAQSRGFLEWHTAGSRAASETFRKNSFPTASGPASRISSRSRVFRAPGATAFTSIENSRNSSAKVSVNRTTAAFDAA